MTFLANENMPIPSVKKLREAGYEVISISEDLPGISDEEVMDKAVEESLIILTFDSDYGELIYKYQKTPPPAVVYFRNKGNSPTWAAYTLIFRLENGLELDGYFTVIKEEGIRQREL